VESNPVELITEAQVTPSSGSDSAALLPVIASLEKSGHKPEEIIADTGYSGARNASEAAGHGVNLCAPAPARGKPLPEVNYPVPAEKCPAQKKEAGEWLKSREAQTCIWKAICSPRRDRGDQFRTETAARISQAAGTRR